MNKNIAALFSGLVFGFGLAVSHMAEPAKVLAFLDVAGRWDPSLLLVMAGAVTVTFIAFRLIARQSKPLFAAHFMLPTRSELDRPLVLGAAIFGVGWGLAGYCPGPGIAALGLGTWEAPVFVAALTVGSLTYRWLFETGTRGATASAERR
jgi:uncharacterized membrane protein YedE/YeeE